MNISLKDRPIVYLSRATLASLLIDRQNSREYFPRNRLCYLSPNPSASTKARTQGRAGGTQALLPQRAE